MSDEVLPAFEIAQRLAAHLDAKGIPYAIGGAIALGAWSDPRGTYDIDLNVFIEHKELDALLDVLVDAGVTLNREAARQADHDGDVVIGHYAGLRIDIFTPSIPFSWEAMKTRRRLKGPSGEAHYLSPEALAVFKMLFFRAKDLVDVEKLVVVQGDGLDRGYVRRWLVDMMGEGDERVAAWDAIVGRAPPS